MSHTVLKYVDSLYILDSVGILALNFIYFDLFQCLHLELKDILQDPKALYPFMQFMKSEASVNVLQFYLSVGKLFKVDIFFLKLSSFDISVTMCIRFLKEIIFFSTEEFNTKLLTPEMSPKALDSLHSELKELYVQYCDPTAPDHIQFDQDIVSEIKDSKIAFILKH